MTARTKPVTFFRPTWVEISSSLFAANVRSLKKFVGSRVKLLAVLKADAYGHGAVSLAPYAVRNGTSFIGVSSLEEALELRGAGIKSPILILGGIYPLENLRRAVQNRITPTVASFEAAQAHLKICKSLGSVVPFHLKVDTGMGRIGVSLEEAKRILFWLAALRPNLLGGVYSHLSSADSDRNFTRQQIKRFKSLERFARTLGFKKTLFHLANTPGTLGHPGSYGDMVRPGLALYGIGSGQFTGRPKLFPVLSWKTKIIFLKKVPAGTPVSYGRTFVAKRASQIATCPVGYADGIPRSVSNRGRVLIQGRLCRIVGRVTMDHIMIDATGIETSVGETVTLIGQQKKAALTVQDWANWAGTILYEILCGISKRVPRVLT